MKISFIKYGEQNKYPIANLFGMDIEEIKEPEQIDQKIEELKQANYTTVVIQNELASFSENIVSKYKYEKNFNIIIMPTKDSHK